MGQDGGTIRGKLTLRFLDGLEPREAPYFAWDTEIKGLAVRVHPTGAKSFWVKYRFQGHQKLHRLGNYPAMTPDQARVLGKAFTGDVAKTKNDPAKEDPAAPAKQARGFRPTVAEFWPDFWKEVVFECKASTVAVYKSIAERLILPYFGKMLVHKINRADVKAFRREGGEARKGGRNIHKAESEATPRQVAQAMAILSKFFKHSIDAAIREDNPCSKIPFDIRKKVESPGIVLGKEELQRLAQALREAEGKESPYALGALKLILFSGMRKSEALTLKWVNCWLDDAPPVLELEDSKTGPKTVILNPQARGVLKELEALRGIQPKNPYVFFGDKPGGHLVNLQKAWARIRKAVGLDHVRLHDLRHNFVSKAISTGASAVQAGRLAGQSSQSVTERYIHPELEPQARVASAIGLLIQEQMALPPEAEDGRFLPVLPVSSGTFLPVEDHEK